MYATTWMRHYIIDYAEQMPHVCVYRIDPVQRKDLHVDYRRHVTLVGHHKPIEYSQFCSLWNKLFVSGIYVDGVKYKCEMRPGINTYI